MRYTLQLAALSVLLTGAATTRAQITNPDALVAPSPRNPARNPIKLADNLQWLWPFTQPEPIGRATELRVDPRFHALLLDDFHQQQAIWGDNPAGHNDPLDAVIPLFLSQHGTVTAQDNRYISVDGCVPSFCSSHGLLWIDLGTPHPLVVFAAVNWSPESHTTSEATANYDLWLFPNRELSPDELPFPLTEALAHWDARLAAAHRLVPHIAQAVLVEPNGTPYALKPELAGANSIAPQPDTSTADDQPARTSELKPRN
jgi:hypothetical protein